MRRFIRWILSHVPRTVMQRCAEIGVPLLGLLYIGRGKECPVCGARRRKFLPYGYSTLRDNALCPSCLSLERHRLLWLYLTRETDIFSRKLDLIHIAPEVCMMRHLKRSQNVEYTTADLESPLADMHFDVQSIPLPDDSYDVIICNHIMEHVMDDVKAMGELHRIMKPGGWGVVLSPVERDREFTYEDDSITDPAERSRIFGQYDHRRVYGRDYAARLSSVGFEVDAVDYIEHFTSDEISLYSLTNEIIYIVHKR